MEEWKRLLRESITAAEDLARYIDVDQDEIRDTVRRYPMRINPYFLGLIREKGDPIGLQVIPDREEIEDRVCVEDPLNEEGDSPVPNIVHRYPDRVLFLVATQCPVYCRFCTRKRKVGTPEFVTSSTIQTGIDYIKGNRGIRDVILSGGDPLLLVDKEIERILEALRRIPHIEIIRIGTRVPSALPQRITRGLCNIIKKYHPVYI
ncbi:MAG: radical SAM protein, partial [Nitrospirota bacterium]